MSKLKIQRLFLLKIAAFAVISNLIFVISPQISYAQGNYSNFDNAEIEAYTMQEILKSGSDFFGKTSGGLAKVINKIFRHYGKPQAYISGIEGSGAFFGGITYGKGIIHLKNGMRRPVFWQGPSLGWDFGAQGSRLMILVYNLSDISELWRRYAGLAGSAYIFAGAGFNVLQRDNVLLIPVRTGVGARLGVNIGYLKLTPHPSYNPF